VQEILETEFGPFAVSIVDAANPFVFVRAADLGLKGTESPQQIDADSALTARLEAIRAAAAVLIGLAPDIPSATRESQSVPKVAFVAGPAGYPTAGGAVVKADDIDFVARMMSLGKAHGAYPTTGAIGTAGAARIEGTIVHEMLPSDRRAVPDVRIGHPGGSIGVGVRMKGRGTERQYLCGTVYRTARRVMDGFVYVPEAVFSGRR